MNPFTDPVLGSLDRDTRLLYLGIVQLFRDTGPVLDDPRFLRAQVFPYDSDLGDNWPGSNNATITKMVDDLIGANKIVRTAGFLVLPDSPEGLVPATLFAVSPPASTAPLEGKVAPKRKRTPLASRAADFQEFWDVYPRRTGIGAAEKSFIAAIGNGATAEEIIEGAIRYRDNCIAIRKEKQFIPLPSTWLNQRRWLDDDEAAEEVRSKADDVMRANLSLVQYYEQQEMLERGSGMLELEQ